MRVAAIGLCDPGYSEDVAREYHARAIAEVKKTVTDIIDAGLQTQEDTGAKAVQMLILKHAEKPFDAIFLVQVAWSRPSVLLQVIRAFPDMPMVVYSPGSSIVDGVIKSIAPTAGIGSTIPILRRHGIKFKYVWSLPGKAIDELGFMPFLRAARAVRQLSGTKLGMIGFGDMRLQTTGFDVQDIHEKFGVEVESMDMLELQKAMDAIDSGSVSRKIKELTPGWTYADDKPHDEVLSKVIKAFLVLEKWADERGYVGLSIKCPTGVTSTMGFTPCLVGCLLARKYQFVCENDIPGLLGQVILNLLSEKTTTYWELYEVLEKGVLLGCCGFCPETLLSESMRVRTVEGIMPGLACCSKVKIGAYTLARLGKRTDGRYTINCIEGAAQEPPAWYEHSCGTLQHPSVKFVPDIPVERLLNEVLAQHFAVVPGRWASELNEFTKILDID
jgi:L-fucose isomerase-like protein